MTEVCTMGTWRPKTGREQEFVAAWTLFAAWAGGMPGAGTLRLTRDDGDPGASSASASGRATKRSAPGRARLTSASASAACSSTWMSSSRSSSQLWPPPPQNPPRRWRKH
jgi:hypothetical protein